MGRFTASLYQAYVCIWKVMPGKRLLAHLLRALPIVRKKLYADMRFKGPFKVRTPAGSFKLYNHGHGTLEASLFWHGWSGQRERESARIWLELARSAQVILDVGANSGTYALSAAVANKKAVIHALEPSARVLEKLKRNIELNGFLNVTAWGEAASSESGIKTLYDVAGEHQYSASLEKDMLPAKYHRPIHVPTIRLDEFFVREGLQSLDLVKIDVEMHEPQALLGFGTILGEQKPAVLVEILTEKIGHEITAILKPMGYLFYDMDERSHPRQTNTIEKSGNLNYLCLQPHHAKLLQLPLHEELAAK